MQKNRWILAGLAGTALIIGCHSFYPSQAAYQQKLNGWIGKSAEELYDTWGFPPQTTPLGYNKIMVTYFYSADAPISAASYITAHSNVRYISFLSDAHW